MASAMLDRYRAFILDMDGVLYLHDSAVEGAAEVMARLEESGAHFVLLTNNSAETREDYARKLSDLGIVDVDPERIITTAQAASRYVEMNLPEEERTAFVIGENGMRAELEANGFELLEGEAAKGAGFVFVGWDRAFDFEKLKTAMLAISSGAHYIATDTDGTYPASEGPWPGTGAFVAAIAAGTGAEPIVVGKPECFIVEMALELTEAGPPEALFIGDRLDSDVQAGINAGMDTMLVLSGVATRADVEESEAEPTYVREDIRGLLDDV